MRRTRIEHMLSAYHPIATDERTSRIGRFVPGRDIAVAYSITSSAWASSVVGSSRPSALAVFRLMTRLYLVGNFTSTPKAME
jgi:hypothetical protein